MFGWLKSLFGVPGPVERGIDLLESGDCEGATKAFEEARAAGDESDLLFQSMARANLSLNLVDDAVRHATRSVLIKPMNPANHAVLASALHRAGRNDDAMKSIDDGLRIDPKNAYLHYLKGLVLVSTGQVDLAVVHFEEFMAFNHSISMARIFTVGESLLCGAALQAPEGVAPLGAKRPEKLLSSLSRRDREAYEKGLAAIENRDFDLATLEFETLAKRRPALVLARLLTACEIYLSRNFNQKPPESRF